MPAIRTVLGVISLSLLAAHPVRAQVQPSWTQPQQPERVFGNVYFEKSFATLSALPCDILLAPHPEAVDFRGRLARRTAGAPDALIDQAALRRYVDGARQRLATRLQRERQAR